MAAADSLNVPEPPRPGDEVGAYRLLQELGVGGMGRVYLAEHRTLGRRVALKVLQPELWHNRRSVQRFFQEARLVNRIDHENIVEIYDYVQEPDGLSYLIMELLVGQDLTQSREQRGPFALARSLPILRQIAGALAAAHAQGVVHRDLKPANVFLVQKGSRRDFVKLLDFGIAKLQDAVNPDGPLTRTGAIVGTPLYMSPEQASGEKIDARSDLYALGVVAYWLLSDSFPFKATSFAELLALQRSQGPSELPRQTPLGDPIPAEVARLVLRCLARSADARFQTAQDVEAHLARITVDLGFEPPPALTRPPSAGDLPRRPPRRALAAVVMLLSALLAAGGTWWWLRPSAPPGAGRPGAGRRAPRPPADATVGRGRAAERAPARRATRAARRSSREALHGAAPPREPPGSRAAGQAWQPAHTSAPRRGRRRARSLREVTGCRLEAAGPRTSR